jgi:L-fuculose-phosphate aldolase
MSSEQHQQILDCARQLNRRGINSGTSGNVSQRCRQGMLITPSGVEYEKLEIENLVWVSLEGEWDRAQSPSSEWRFHRDIYQQREDAMAIVHVHPVFSTALACMGKRIPAFHYMVAVAGGEDIPCAPYATFGSQELSDHLLMALKGRKASLMENHGLTCLGSDLENALSLAIEVENLAKMYCQCLPMGEPNLLGQDEMARVIRQFRHYGKN